MIRNEKTDMVLHSGDFDYLDDPTRWDDMISQVLGDDFPYFAPVGNHDVVAWPEYQRKLQERLARIDGANCKGDLGVNSSCTYKGLFFVLSGVGTLDSGRVSYIREALASEGASESLWRICSWHKNRRLMQVGTKSDEVGWEPYDECRRGGAIIATGHEHSYSRTHLMSSFETQSIVSKSAVLHVDEGKSFAFVSGLAGASIRGQDDQLASNPWWAAVHTSAQGANYGALFCNFNDNGVANKAVCYFKDLNGVIADVFEVVVGLDTETPVVSPSIQDPIVLKQELEYSYKINLPDDWVKKDEDRYSSPSPRLHLEIISHPVPSGQTVYQFSQSVEDNLRDDWADWWFTPSLLEITSVNRKTIDDQTTVRIRYRVKESEPYCVLDVEEVVLVSRILPEYPQVFRVRAWMCESRVASRSQMREDILNSVEAITRPSLYYTQFLPVKGVLVKAHGSVDPTALQAAVQIVDGMLSGREDIVQCMAWSRADLAIIPRDQTNTDLPEFAYLAGTGDFTGRSRDTFEIRGLGAVRGQPVSSAGEEQLLGNPGPQHPYYSYRGWVAAHEYAHAVQNLCFKQADHEQWNGLYEDALDAGLYPASHMMADVNEFFAVLSTAYFEVTSELGDPSRENLKSRFPLIFRALDEIYGGATLPEEFRVWLPRPQ